MSTVYWSIFRAALTVGGLSIVIKLVSVFKEGLVAFRFGTAPELDAFLLAYAFPAFLLNVLTGSLATAFVPTYIRVTQSDGEDAALALAGGLSWLLAGGLVLGAFLLIPLFAAFINLIANRFDDATLNLTTEILFVLAPVLIFQGIAGFWTGFLNAKQSFAPAATVPVATPLIVAASLVLLWDRWGVYSIVVGTLMGGLVELLLIGAIARRHGLRILAFPASWTRYIGRILPEFATAAGGNILISATLLVDQAMAAMLSPGSVAVLNFGLRVPAAIVGVGSMALATALLPHLSRIVADGRFEELRLLLRRYSVLTLGIAIPVTLVLVAFSSTIISILFQRGSFGESDTVLVAQVQAAYALHIPFFAWAMIAVRLISAMQANRLLMIGAAISLVLDIVLNWVLSRYFGVLGIAMSTACVYLVACAYLWSAALAKLRRISA